MVVAHLSDGLQEAEDWVRTVQIWILLLIHVLIHASPLNQSGPSQRKRVPVLNAGRLLWGLVSEVLEGPREAIKR